MSVDGSQKRRMLSYRWLVYGTIGLAYFFVFFHRTTGGAISTDLQEYYGVGASSVALLASAYLYAYTLMQIPSGIITDRFGPRKAVTVFVLLIALGSAISAYSANTGDFDLMIVGKIVIGAGAAVVAIPALKILTTWFRLNEFATMNGVLLLIGNIGGIVAATPMIMMIDSVGLEATYLLLAVITVVISGLCWLVVRDRPEDKGFPTIGQIEAEEGRAPAPVQDRDVIGTKDAFRMILSDLRGFWSVAIFMFILYGTIMVWQASQAGAFYQHVYGYDSTEASLMVTMVGVGILMGAPLSGLLSDRIFGTRKGVLLTGAIAFACVWLVMWTTCGSEIMGPMPIQAVINFLFGFFGAFYVVAGAQVKEQFPTSIAGKTMALLNVFPFAGGAILVSLTGFLVSDGTVEQYGSLWCLMFILSVMACVAAAFSRERPE